MIVPQLLYLIAALVILGVILWGITQIPMDPAIAQIVRVIIIVIAAVVLIYFLLGLVGGVGSWPHHGGYYP